MLLTVCTIAITTTACTDAPTTSVAGLTGANLALDTSANIAETPAVSVSISSSNGCPTIADDVTATYDGVPMTIATAGGSGDSWDGPYCDPIQLVLATAAANPGQPSTFVLSDSTATWTVSGEDLLTNDLMSTSDLSPGKVATIEWPSAPAIAGAYVEFDNRYNDMQFAEQLPDYQTPPAGTIVGDTLQFDVPTGTTGGFGSLSVDASRIPSAIRCDGPVACQLGVSAHLTIAATIH